MVGTSHGNEVHRVMKVAIVEQSMEAHGSIWKRRLVFASKDLSKCIYNSYLVQKLCFQLEPFLNPVGHQWKIFVKLYCLNPDP